jgi:hypothetical protein
MGVAAANRQQGLATAAEVAAFLGGDFSEKTLANWRCQGKGPKFTKLGDGRGAPVRYRWVDVNAWLEAQSKTPEPV